MRKKTDCSAAMLQVSADTLKQLQTRKATVTPSWWALLIMFKYRSRQNFKQADFLGEQQTLVTVGPLTDGATTVCTDQGSEQNNAKLLMACYMIPIQERQCQQK